VGGKARNRSSKADLCEPVRKATAADDAPSGGVSDPLTGGSNVFLYLSLSDPVFLFDHHGLWVDREAIHFHLRVGNLAEQLLDVDDRTRPNDQRRLFIRPCTRGQKPMGIGRI